MSGIKSQCLFYVLPEIYDPDKGYPLVTVWPGVYGVRDTDFYCGHDFDLALEYCNELNISNGYEQSFSLAVLNAAIGLDKIHFFGA
jgi:hypothetical protein